MKKITAIVLSTLLLITAILAIPAFSSEEISVYIDGVKIEFDVNPEIIDGRTMVPLRKIFEEIGALVKWDAETKTITARKSSKTVTLTVDSKELTIDKGKTDDEGNPVIETVTLEVPPQIVEGRTLVPARAISESFGLLVSWDGEEKKVSLNSEENDEAWKENTGSINLTDLTAKGDGVEFKDNNVYITKGGDFDVKGTLKNGSITVDTKERVKLRLKGVSIETEEGPCIYFKDTDKAFITLSGDNDNYLVAKNSEDGAIYSKENLEIKGGGTLTIESQNGHGIKASDNLTVEEGVINIEAASDGLHINETFKMTGGNIKITAFGDGIDSESIVIIEDGNINIETKGEPVSGTSAETEEAGRKFPMMEGTKVEFETSSKGINGEWMISIKGGTFKIKSAYHAIHCSDDIEVTGGKFNLYSEYGKGISAHGDLTVSGENTKVNIEKSTEGIESKNVLTVNDGYFVINSTDDAINATGGSGGMMMGMGQRPGAGENTGNENAGGRMPGRNRTMPRGEGAESAPVTMPEGMMEDWRNRNNEETGEQGNMRPGRFDGETEGGEAPQNPMGGRFPFEGGEMDFNPENIKMPENQGRPGGMGNMGGMPGGMGRNSRDCIIINGGTFEIFGGDDCIDANGNLLINDGVIKATYPSGSFSGNFGVMDSDGQLTVGEKATLIFATGSGNERGISLNQNMVVVNLKESHGADEKITVTDKNGEEILSYTALGKFSAILLSSEKLALGENYKITVGEESFETEITEKSTVVGERAAGNSGFGRNFLGRPF